MRRCFFLLFIQTLLAYSMHVALAEGDSVSSDTMALLHDKCGFVESVVETLCGKVKCQAMSNRMHMHTHACIHACTHSHMHARTHSHSHTHMHTLICLPAIHVQVTSSRRMEHDYALGLLLVLPPQLAMGQLQRLRTRLQSASNYSSVIVSCFVLTDLQTYRRLGNFHH